MLPGTPRTFIGTTTFTVGGLSDGTRRSEVVERIAEVPGVTSVAVDASTGLVEVRAATPVDRAEIAAVVTAAGFTLIP